MNVRREGTGSPERRTTSSPRPDGLTAGRLPSSGTGVTARLELADGPAKDDTEGNTESGLQSFELSRGTKRCRDSSIFRTA